MSRCHSRHTALAAAVILLAALGATLLLRRQTNLLQERFESRQALLQRLRPDLERAERYADAELLLLSAATATPPLPPADAPPAERSEQRRLAVVGDWEGLQHALGWSDIETLDAFRLINHYATNPPPWRLAGLKLEALEQQAHCRLELLLESALSNGAFMP